MSGQAINLTLVSEWMNEWFESWVLTAFACNSTFYVADCFLRCVLDNEQKHFHFLLKLFFFCNVTHSRHSPTWLIISHSRFHVILSQRSFFSEVSAVRHLSFDLLSAIDMVNKWKVNWIVHEAHDFEANCEIDAIKAAKKKLTTRGCSDLNFKSLADCANFHPHVDGH